MTAEELDAVWKQYTRQVAAVFNADS